MTNGEATHERLLLAGVRVVLPACVLEEANVLVEGGRIARIYEDASSVEAHGARVFDLKGLTLVPGFIDFHIHGSVGVDANDTDADGLHDVARFLASRGVTAWLPTLVPAPAEESRRAVESIAALIRTQDERPPAARVAGLHYEGPFVNTRQCGALRTAYFRTFKDPSDLDDLPTLETEGAAHLMTLAPEVEGGAELVGELVRRGGVVFHRLNRPPRRRR